MNDKNESIYKSIEKLSGYEKMITTVIIGAILVWMAFIGLTCYVAYHFVSKYW